MRVRITRGCLLMGTAFLIATGPAGAQGIVRGADQPNQNRWNANNDAITVGDTTFTFYFTPGHTIGSTSVEYPVRAGGRTHRALTPGGLGLHYAPEWGPTFKTSMERLRALGPWDVVLGNHPFLGPMDLEVIEAQLRSPGQAAHPAVIGAARVTGFFDAIVKIVDEKLVAEPPPR